MSSGHAFSISDDGDRQYVRDAEFSQDWESSSEEKAQDVGTPKSVARVWPEDPRATDGVAVASELAVRPLPEMAPSGIAELDQLTGGIPRGALTEIVGPPSSGRTSVLMALLAKITRCREVCALVDVSDCFDPSSAQQAGVILQRLLWVRCGDPLPDNIGQQSTVKEPGSFLLSEKAKSKKRIFALVEQGLKATDLLLQSGGFGLVVMDMGNIPPEVARRVPLTSWFRFRRAVEKTPTILLVLEEEPFAKSCASLVISLSSELMTANSINSTETLENFPSHAQLIRGLKIRAEIIRSPQQQRKPVHSVSAVFESLTPWSRWPS